jgi:methionyl aminopeptidase
MTERRSSGLDWFASLLGKAAPEPPPSVARSHPTPEHVGEVAQRVRELPEARTREESRRLAPIVSDILRITGTTLTPGTTTQDLCDRLVRQAARHGLLPAMLGYRAFPAGAAVSLNEEIVHGVPGKREIAEGDLVKLQFAVVSSAGYAAQAWTFPVGAPPEADRPLFEAGPRALRAAVEAASAKAYVGDLGAAIRAEVKAAGLTVVRAFVGYRMGGALIMPPQIEGTGSPGTGARLEEGWVLHLHVVLKHGKYPVFIADDHWTAVAADGKRGALFTAMVEVGSRRGQLLGALLDEA